METPSEWAKRFNQGTAEHAGAPNPQTETVESPAAVADFPSEPFQCPACGQLLAPACRVCVACRRAIDPAEVARVHVAAVPAVSSPGPSAPPVRYPWRIFFAFMGISFLLAIGFEGLLGEQRAQLAMGGVQALAGIWVFFDALRQRVPRPLRWGFGSMLLPVVVFPWYLARRKTPQSPVPFVEAEAGPVTRFLLFALLVFILASLIFTIVKGPSPLIRPSSPVPEHKGGDGSPSRIAGFTLKRDSGRRAGKSPDSIYFELRAQVDTSAPSEAWQT
ncbi:MAG: hypothetical protein ACLQVG_21610 [Terriglobia bacterium]